MEKPRDRLEDARSAKLRIELSERRVARVDRQQRSEERHRRSIGLTKRRRSCASIRSPITSSESLA